MALVPLHGQVGAGKVIQFHPRNEVVPVAIPRHIKESDVETVLVSGVSLIDDGISDGDLLIFTKRFDPERIAFKRICIIFIHSTQELVAKKIVPCGDGMITLRSANKQIPDMMYPIEDVEIKGVVFSFQRMLR